MTIRTRVTLVGMGVVTLVICCLSATLFALISRGLDTDRDAELAARLDELVSEIATAPAEDLTPVRPLAPVDPRSDLDIFVLVLAADGSVLRATGEVSVPPGVLAEAQRSGGTSATVPVAGGEPAETVRVIVRPWSRPDLELGGYAVAAQTSRRTDQDRAGLVLLFAVTGLITFAAAAAAVWVATGRALRPLRQMAAMADEVGRSADLSRRLPAVGTKDTVGRLTSSFNAMMDRLQDAYARVAGALTAQQRFTADASHELRTPLTTIRNNAEFLLQHPQAQPADREAALRDIAGEAGRMGRLIENLLTLARADSGGQPRREPVDVAGVAGQVCRQAAALHPQRDLSFAGTPARAVAGDEEMITQLLWILLDNAVKYTSAGGHVWVAVTQRGSAVQLTVADDGAGIPPGDELRIFDRFYRGDSARSGAGAGLGLAIAAWIVAAHGGSVVAANNDRGGATFAVELPAAPKPDETTLAVAPQAHR